MQTEVYRTGEEIKEQKHGFNLQVHWIHTKSFHSVPFKYCTLLLNLAREQLIFEAAEISEMMQQDPEKFLVFFILFVVFCNQATANKTALGQWLANQQGYNLLQAQS